MSEDTYLAETGDHVVLVQWHMANAIINLRERSYIHDRSKLEDPEKSGFMAMTADARLKDLEYGSEQYRAVLREHEGTIQHHYAKNDHHPEHTAAGIAGMSLLALIEMLCDWKASTGRMKGGDLRQSIIKNQKRFGYDDTMASVLLNTAEELGMLEESNGST